MDSGEYALRDDIYVVRSIFVRFTINVHSKHKQDKPRLRAPRGGTWIRAGERTVQLGMSNRSALSRKDDPVLQPTTYLTQDTTQNPKDAL